jgi:ribosomal protein S12 methylthiotransferase accessory factor
LAEAAAAHRRGALLDELGELRRQLGRLAAGVVAKSPDRPTPRETLAAIEPHLLSLGITRVGDLTGLDVVGIPVFFACRPNSRGLSVGQGKGLCSDAARLGAIMECFEQAFAERPEDLVTEHASRGDMEARGLQCMPSSSMLRSALGEPEPGRQRSWVTGLSMVDGRHIHVPFELVGFDLRSGAGWDHAHYTMSTVGLGAGASLEEASLHALLEVVENDATALIDVFGQLAGFTQPVEYRRGHHLALDEAMTMIAAAGLGCFFVNVKNRVALPTIAAYITTPGETHAGSGARAFAGFACRLSPEEAALAALLEAVQSRLTQIAGARDDLTAQDYSPRRSMLRQLRRSPSFLDGLQRPELASDATALEKLGHALAAVQRAGAQEVVFVPLGGLPPGIRAVRVLVAGLQAAAGDGVVRVSLEALDAALAQTVLQ